MSNFTRKIRRTQRGGILPQFVGEDGQSKVVLVKNGVKEVADVCKLVAQAFVPNPQNLPYVRHKNGDKRDNRADNLEWSETPEC